MKVLRIINGDIVKTTTKEWGFVFAEGTIFEIGIKFSKCLHGYKIH